ncbi:MAG: phosphoribosylamine--glycine ligase [Candidatus Nezhaarchaeota archaeon]|nr:phosphoribosylamine--glycine ligase [Candidatus Nezhaarchaeota archaeon]MCX8141427.1 phosphoribosylamine--glycine ligase [Candidatus Nezhaarchaeota archaeon]MDW8049693.1 phosphoribosylamine--glycine ligase [Nitrososphaerota archaeon]
MVKVLVIGDASREHAITDAFFRSVHEPRIYAAMSRRNPGITRLSKQSGGDIAIGDINNPEFIVKVAKDFNVDFAFVGPEEPLFHGVADALEELGIPCVGAKRQMALVEMSKAFMRRLMWKYKVPGRLRFKAFKSLETAVAYVNEYAESVAIKPARQAGGKGVKVIADLQVYLSKEKREVKKEHVKAVYEKHMAVYDDIDDKVLIEERVEGPEYTLQVFTDGRHVLPLPAVQDNKNAYEMDIGPETGGMGSISGPGWLLPFLTEEEYRRSVEIIQGVIDALWKETGVRYKGVISGQMMLTALWGPTIIEFYSRFGDPEACNVLPYMEADIVEISEAIIDERLNTIKISFPDIATVVKAVAPKGYPDYRDLAKGHPVRIDEETIRRKGCKVYYGSLDERPDGVVVTAGSRIAEIVAAAPTIPEASNIVEGCIQYVGLLDGWGTFHRSDIGSEVLLRKRIEQAQLIREIYRYRASRGLIGKTIDWIPGKGKIEYEF